MPYKFDPENPFTTEKLQPEKVVNTDKSRGLKIDHFFSTPGVHPFDELEWEKRSAKITDDSGKAVFEQDNIEVPTSWSQLPQRLWPANTFTEISKPASESIP